MLTPWSQFQLLIIAACPASWSRLGFQGFVAGVAVVVKGGGPGGSRRPPGELLVAGDIQGGGPNVVAFEGVEGGLIKFIVVAGDAGGFTC